MDETEIFSRPDQLREAVRQKSAEIKEQARNARLHGLLPVAQCCAELAAELDSLLAPTEASK